MRRRRHHQLAVRELDFGNQPVDRPHEVFAVLIRTTRKKISGAAHEQRMGSGVGPALYLRKAYVSEPSQIPGPACMPKLREKILERELDIGAGAHAAVQHRPVLKNSCSPDEFVSSAQRRSTELKRSLESGY